MKTIIATVALTAGVLVGGVIVASPSEAKSLPKSWMTIQEYKKIKRGMTIKQVRKIVGSNGRVWWSNIWDDEAYCATWADDYMTCTSWVPARHHESLQLTWRTGKWTPTGGLVWFEDGRVYGKQIVR